MEHYVFQLTQAVIDALSIGPSPVENFWFWAKASLYFVLAVHIVDAFI